MSAYSKHPIKSRPTEDGRKDARNANQVPGEREGVSLSHRSCPFDAAVARFLADADAVVLLQVARSCGRESAFVRRFCLSLLPKRREVLSSAAFVFNFSYSALHSLFFISYVGLSTARSCRHSCDSQF